MHLNEAEGNGGSGTETFNKNDGTHHFNVSANEAYLNFTILTYTVCCTFSKNPILNPYKVSSVFTDI
jgi:hypothetical protein